MALPNGPLEIVFSFDTTGSMCCYLDEVRGRISDMVQRLQADIPGIRIAIFAHGDYCARPNYVTKFVDFTDDVGKLCNFVKGATITNGGDLDECYELVLYEVRTKLSWQPGSQRALVMIGDANPHEPDYPGNRMNIDWRKEVESLRDNGVRIYGVNCGHSCENFYKTISNKTGGHYLKLSDFKQVFDFLMSVCYNEKGADMLHMYEKEVRARGGPVHTDLNRLFGDLRDTSPAGSRLTSSVMAKSALLKTHSKPSTMGVLKKSQKTHVSAKTRKTVKSRKSSLAKYRLDNLPRLPREDVPENYFLLNDKKWTNWQLVLSPEAKPECPKTRHGNRAGFRARQIFSDNTQRPALYEVAVQPKSRSRKFVVHCKCSRMGFMSGSNWERKFFNKKEVASQIESALKKGCSVFMRRTRLGALRHTDEACRLLKRYDYAWSVVKSERNTHRPVTKATVDISEEMEV